MNDENIGRKILEHRKNKQLNLRELAKLTGVTPSLLSQIERGLANPSLHTLKAIADALEIPLFSLFATSTRSKEFVVKADKRKKMILPERENIIYELLSPDLNGAIEFALMTLAHNMNTSEELIEHEGEEVAYVIEGKANLYFEDNIMTLETGDSVRIPRGTRHKWENPYDLDATVIFAVTPPSF